MIHIYKKGENQLRIILFVRFRIPHVFIHNTSTSLTLKPSFVRGLSNPQIGHRPYLEKLKIRVETRYTGHSLGGVTPLKRSSPYILQPNTTISVLTIVYVDWFFFFFLYFIERYPPCKKKKPRPTKQTKKLLNNSNNNNNNKNVNMNTQ